MKRRLAAVLAVLLPGTAFAAWVATRRPPLPPPPTAQRLADLAAERDALRVRFQQTLLTSGENSLAEAPQGGVMIGIPTAFTKSVLDQVVTGLFGETTLTLRNLKVRARGAVKAKLLIAKHTLGKYDVDVRIHQVQGLLKPGAPRFGFGRNTIEVTLPVRLAEGAGNADLRLQWNSKGVGDLVCGDVDVTHAVGGTVTPQSYEVTGRFVISGAGDAILLRPQFPDLAVRVFPEPSQQAWDVVDGVIRDRPKGCEIAVSKVDVKEKLGRILGKGFKVKIPQKIFKPVRLPAGVRQSLEIQGIRLALDVKPAGILVARDRIWYSANLTLRPSAPPAPALQANVRAAAPAQRSAAR